MMKYKLKGLRVGAGYKAGEFAEELGISRQYLRLLENGQATNPNKKLMVKIAKLLNTDVNYLFFESEE